MAEPKTILEIKAGGPPYQPHRGPQTQKSAIMVPLSPVIGVK